MNSINFVYLIRTILPTNLFPDQDNFANARLLSPYRYFDFHLRVCASSIIIDRDSLFAVAIFGMKPALGELLLANKISWEPQWRSEFTAYILVTRSRVLRRELRRERASSRAIAIDDGEAFNRLHVRKLNDTPTSASRT